MHHSDDEDSFQSADEDGFDEGQPPKERKSSKSSSSSSSESDRADLNKPLDGGSKKGESHVLAQDKSLKDSTIDEATREEIRTDEDGESESTSNEPTTEPQSPQIKQQSAPISAKEHLEAEIESEEAGDDDEEALAERIRERNLKIAKKFSAEIAKNNKASAPVPVQSSMPIGFKVNDIEYPSIAGADTKSGLPPAPPPTPALSSSFNNLTDDQQPTEPSMKSQYGWRLPPKSTPTTTHSKSSNIVDTPKGDQARLALDRLSANVSHSDKNLFEKVTADLKKVSIKSDDPPVPDLTASAPALPSITDLGTTLGGWGWSGASKLLSSASQVTSQVSSVLDSVVNVSQHLHQSSNSSGTGDNYGNTPSKTTTTKTTSDSEANFARPSKLNDGAPTKTVTSTPTTSSENERNEESRRLDGESVKNKGVASSETLPSGPLVDYTLSAMESLGKKAFNVMTERDESGSLQIKGLGRPWEQLKKLNKSYQEFKKECEEELEERLGAHQQQHSKPSRGAPSRETIDYDTNNFDELEPSTSLETSARSKVATVCYDDDGSRPTTLKNRKRYNHNDDNLD